jgi:hypothetical protein
MKVQRTSLACSEKFSHMVNLFSAIRKAITPEYGVLDLACCLLVTSSVGGSLGRFDKDSYSFKLVTFCLVFEYKCSNFQSSQVPHRWCLRLFGERATDVGIALQFMAA